MRVHGWPQKLDAKVEEWRSRAFAWGTVDCCQFAAEVVAALTGDDKRALFPAYTDEAEARAIIAAHGGLSGLVTAALGEQKHPSRAMRGDVVLLDRGQGELIGICIGARIVAPGLQGLEFAPMGCALAAWSV